MTNLCLRCGYKWYSTAELAGCPKCKSHFLGPRAAAERG